MKLTVFDITGREVKTLVNETKSSGTHKVELDGSELASGIYLARMEATPPSVPPAEARGIQSKTVKMVLLK